MEEENEVVEITVWKRKVARFNESESQGHIEIFPHVGSSWVLGPRIRVHASRDLQERLPASGNPAAASPEILYRSSRRT